METKVNALMLRGVDYKDNDKILTLYSLERGKISASARGVKKSGAKLSFCAAPFCFAEYVLSEKSERLSVINATEIESFYKLRLNVFGYCAASAIAEFLLKFTEEGQPEPVLFRVAVSALKAICFENAEPAAVLISFLCIAVKNIGYAADFSVCASCGENTIGERPFFDFSEGKYYCENCATASAVRILPQTACALRFCAETLNEESDYSFCADTQTRHALTGDFLLLSDEDKLARMRALAFLNHYLSIKCGEKLKSIAEYAKLANFT